MDDLVTMPRAGSIFESLVSGAPSYTTVQVLSETLCRVSLVYETPQIKESERVLQFCFFILWNLQKD